MLNKDAWEKAKKVTASFEGGSVAGDFDKQGLSMGLLQWNLGQGTLQPILKDLFSTYPDMALKHNLTEFKKALDKGNGAALTFARQNMNAGGRTLAEPWKTRLAMVNNSVEFKTISDKYCNYYINTATKLCKVYNLSTDRAFALFFDIAVQMGNLPVIPLKQTQYLEKLNAIAMYAASRANKKWQSDVLKRKQAIVFGKDMGRGWCGVTFSDASAFTEKESVLKLEDALKYLKEQGVIFNMEYWLKVAEKTQYFDLLLERIVSKLAKKN